MARGQRLEVIENKKGLSKKGKIVSLNMSKKKGQKKTPVESMNLIAGKGVEGDAHFSSERQISLLSYESIEKMQKVGLEVSAGSFAENITVGDINLKSINIGSKVKLGNALIEITQKGKDCHEPCEIYRQAGYCVMPEEGIFASILKSSKIKNGDTVEVLN